MAWARSMSPFLEKSRFIAAPKSEISPKPQISRGSGAQRPGYRPTRVLHATVPSGSGPARKHTAKFEPAAAWSWGLWGPNDERFRRPKTRFE